jgi:hypothetical protein
MFYGGGFVNEAIPISLKCIEDKNFTKMNSIAIPIKTLGRSFFYNYF